MANLGASDVLRKHCGVRVLALGAEVVRRSVLEPNEGRIEPRAGFLGFAGVSDSDGADRDEAGRQLEYGSEARDALFPGMNPQPAGAESENVGAQQQVLDGRRAVLQQVAELPVMGGFKVAAHHDSQGGRSEHSAVRQSVCDLGQQLAVADDDEAPRILAGGGGGRHGRLEQLLDRLVRYGLGGEHADASAAEDEIEVGLGSRAHKVGRKVAGRNGKGKKRRISDFHSGRAVDNPVAFPCANPKLLRWWYQDRSLAE